MNEGFLVLYSVYCIPTDKLITTKSSSTPDQSEKPLVLVMRETCMVVCRLYTVNGDLIHQPHTQLQHKGYYVAVGSEFGGFKQVKYGNPLKPAFVTYAGRR